MYRDTSDDFAPGPEPWQSPAGRYYSATFYAQTYRAQANDLTRRLLGHDLIPLSRIIDAWAEHDYWLTLAIAYASR